MANYGPSEVLQVLNKEWSVINYAEYKNQQNSTLFPRDICRFGDLFHKINSKRIIFLQINIKRILANLSQKEHSL